MEKYPLIQASAIKYLSPLQDYHYHEHFCALLFLNIISYNRCLEMKLSDHFEALDMGHKLLKVEETFISCLFNRLFINHIFSLRITALSHLPF